MIYSPTESIVYNAEALNLYGKSVKFYIINFYDAASRRASNERGKRGAAACGMCGETGPVASPIN